MSTSRIHTQLQKAEQYVSHQDYYIREDLFSQELEVIKQNLEAYHQKQPLGKGLARDQLGVSQTAIRGFILARALSDGVLKNHGDLWQLSGHQGTLDAGDEQLRQNIIKLFEASAFSPPSTGELSGTLDAQSQTILQWMIQHGDLVRIDKEYYILNTQLDLFYAELRKWFSSHTELSISELREIIPSTRKYLLPILHYAERKGLLLRDGDIRRWVGEEL